MQKAITITVTIIITGARSFERASSETGQLSTAMRRLPFSISELQR
jgi:hypothetical protein